MSVPDVVINYAAVLVAAVAAFILGALWYSPLLFGKLWMREMKISPEKAKNFPKKKMMILYATQFIAAIVTAFVFAHFLKYLTATTISDALQGAFWVWLGFFATVQLGTMLWEGKSGKLYMINVGYNLATLIVTSLILVLWQ